MAERWGISRDAARIHRKSLVWDMVWPLEPVL